MLAFVAGNTVKAEVILWQEDFSSYEAEAVPAGGTYKYVCADNGANLTKIYGENIAGGTAPELLIGKYNSKTSSVHGSFSATVPMNGKSGEMVLSFKRNNKSLTVTATGATLGKSTRTGNTDEYPVTVTAGTTEVTFTFTAGSDNVRFDDVKLYQGEALKPAGLSWGTASREAFLDKSNEENKIPVLTNSNNLPVTYGSSDTNVATITAEGAVTLVGTGKSTISAAFAGNDVYEAQTVTYELTVKASEAVNTLETAFTVAQAHEFITAGEDLTSKVYVKGIITKIDDIDTEGTYGNATYYIGDTADDDQPLEVYRGFGLNGQKFNEEGATLIKEGDVVVVYGKVKDFDGTHEFDASSKIVSLNPTPAPAPIVFTDQLTVTVNDQSGTLEASVNLIKHEDGTIDFSLPNFVLASGEDVMPVGNININGLTLVPGEQYDSFSYDGPLTIAAGDLEGIDFWMGPMLGELPLKLQGKVNFGSHKLFVNIDIDLSATLQQIINVKFGTDFEETPAEIEVEVQEEVDVPELTYDYALGNTGAEGTYDTSMVEDAIGCTPSNAVVYGFNPTTEEYVVDAMTTYDGWHAANGDLAAKGEAPFCIKMWNNGTFWYCTDPEKAETGATYKTSWLLVNPETGDAVQYNFTLKHEPAPYVGPAKNQLFTASTPQRGGWMNVDGALKGTLEAGANVETDATDANQLFALVDYEGKTYLWNEGAQHFLNDAGQFVSILTATPIYCTEEAGYEGICDKTYFFHFSEEKNINLGGSKQIIIDDWAEADAGNMMIINAAEGFDAEAVAAVIKSDTSLAITSITWTITDGEGNEIGTETQTQCEEGKEYTVQFSLYGVELKGETTVTAGKEDQNITLVAEFTGTLPVEYAASLDKVEHWYALRLHSNQQHWLYSDEGTLAFAGEEAQTDEYAWALVGDPLRGFQLYNKALGADAALDAANPCTLSEDGLTARFYVHPTAEANHVDDGFCLKAYGESQYLNYQGGAIKRWGAADAGSTFVFDEIVDIPDGISAMTTDNRQQTIYNLQGQQIGTAFRGIYLQNRKKVLVK